MDTLRNWREWLGRWMSTPPVGGMELAELLQGVVIVDDVTALQVPPLVGIFGFYNNQGAVAGQFPTIILQPQSRAIIVSHVKFQATTMQYGVNDGDAAATGTTVVPSFRIQGPIGSTADAVARVGPTATDLNPAGLNAVLVNGVTHELDILVIPGQFFWLQFTTGLSASEFERIEWVEIPAEFDQIVTSQPRV